MLITFTLDLWLLLPLLLTVVLVAGGLWIDRFELLNLEGTVIAQVICALCWVAVLYGRYEHWLVVPLLITITTAVGMYRDRKKVTREAMKFLCSGYAAGWALLLYGRLTA